MPIKSIKMKKVDAAKWYALSKKKDSSAMISFDWD